MRYPGAYVVDPETKEARVPGAWMKKHAPPCDMCIEVKGTRPPHKGKIGVSENSCQVDHVPILQKGTRGEDGMYCFITENGRISATPVQGRSDAVKAYDAACHTLGRITQMNCDKASEIYRGDISQEAKRNGCIILHGASEQYSDHSRVEAVQPRFIQLLYLLLKDQQMHPKYWPYACNQAQSIWNNTHHASINGIPNEHAGITPLRLHLQPDFGQLCYARRTKHNRRKNDRTSDAVVLGYCMGQVPRATPNVLNVMCARTNRIHDYGNVVPIPGAYYRDRKKKPNEQVMCAIREFLSEDNIDEQLEKLDTICNNGGSESPIYNDPREEKRQREVSELIDILKQQTIVDERDPDDHDPDDHDYLLHHELPSP